MAVVDQRALNGAQSSEHLLSVVVISASTEMQNRIAAALEAQDLQLLAVLDSPTAVTGLDTDDSAIVVFICDVDVPQEVTSLRRLCREPNVPAVVVISPPATGAGVRRTLDAGADALVFEPELESTLVTTICAVASGQTVVPGKLRAGVERPTLSHREHQVLTLVRQGLTNAEIAERLYLAESTVKSHLASVFTKLGVHSRKEAVAVFIDLDMTPVTMPAPVGFEHSPEEAPA
jgi:DNA-binding NarL/FixJ family response regulator